MNKQTVDRLLEELGPLAEKLGEGAEYAFRLAVRQAYVEGFLNLLYAVIAAILTYVAIRLVRFCHDKHKESSRYDDGWFFGGLGAGFAGLTTSIFGFIALWSALSALLNPEFYALKALLKAVTG